jgi:hypothetical protein
MGITYSGKAGLGSYENDQQFDFIIHHQEILQALVNSKNNETAIGVYSLSLGTTMYITGVDNIDDSENPIITFKKYDMSGHIFERSTLHLSEIVSVCPFTSPLKNPFLESLENDSDWFSIINSTESPSSLHQDTMD